jgi:serine phosphatase RsbU (regulator of sigma subunit)/pSer/pThr/pTyr-binding forkhead associated (FHA) protein
MEVILPMPELRTVEGPHAGGVFQLERESAVLGRHPDCDIVLDSGAVSRQHARILRIDNAFFIEDMQSRNGTYVNGRQIRERFQLDDQDRITLCDVVLVFKDERRQPPPPHGIEAQSKTTPIRDTATVNDTGALLIDDEPEESSSTVMQRVNVSSGASSLHFEQNPQAKLKALMEISMSLGRALSVQDVLPKVLDSLFTIFPHGDRGVIVLRDGPSGKLIPRAHKHRRPDLVDTVRISRTLVKGVMESKEAILSADASSDKRFAASESIVDFHIRSVMCAPLVTNQGHVTGVIQIDTSDQRNRFTRDDLEVLASVACQAAVAVENAELHETAVRDQRRSRELEVAHDVMRGFLPQSPPTIEGYEFFDFYEPANELGGDYYDYIRLPGKRLAIVVADVSGKGIPASLLMARLSADVRYCLASEPSPAVAVAELNRAFMSGGWDDRFVTLLLAVLDPQKHELTFVDAGHPPAYLYQQGKAIAAIDDDNTRLPIGVAPDAEYTQVTYQLAPGDRLAMYTDGFSEAMNAKDELYGLDRLHKQMGIDSTGVAAQGRNILRNVKEFVGDRSQSDDMCLVCFGRVE